MIKKFSGDDFDQILEEIERFLKDDEGKNYKALCTDTTILHNGKIIILLTYTYA